MSDLSTVDNLLLFLGIKSTLTPQQDREKKDKIAKRKKELEEAKAQVLYENASVEGRREHDRLQNLPATFNACADIDNLLREASVLAGQNQYQQALDVLKPVPAKVKEGDNLAKEAKLRAERDSKPLMDRKNQLAGRVQDHPQLPPKDKDYLKARVEAAVNALYRPKVDENVRKVVSGILDQAENEIKQREQEAVTNQLNAEGKYNEAQLTIQKLEPLVPPTEVAVLKQDLLGVKTLRDERDHVAAALLAQKIKDEADQKLREIQAATDKWEQDKAKLEQALQKAQELAGTKLSVLESPPRVADTIKALTTLKGQQVGKDLSHAKACELLEGYLEQNSTNDERVTAFRELESLRTEADKKVKEGLKAVPLAVQKLWSTPEFKRSDPSGEIRELSQVTQTLKEIAAEWTAKMKTAISEDELDAEGTLGRLASLQEMLAEAEKNGDKRQTLIRDHMLAPALKEYRKAAQGCQTELDKLIHFAVPEEADLRKQLARFEQQVQQTKDAKYVRARADDVGQLANEITEVMKKAASTAIGKQKTAKELLGTVDRSLLTLEEKLKRYDESFLTQNPQYKQLAQALRKELDTIKGEVDCTDTDILGHAEEELKKLSKRILQTNDGLEGRVSLTGDAPSLEKIDRLVANCRIYLENENLRLYLGDTKTKLEDELNKIAKGKTQTAMDVTEKSIADWKKKIQQAGKDTAKAKEEADTLVKQFGELKDQLDEKNVKSTAREYYDSVVKRIDDGKEEAKKESGRKAAGLTLEALKMELKRLDDDPGALDELQKAAEETKQQASVDQVKWETAYKEYTDKLLSRVEQKKPLPRYLDELKELGKMANKTFTKTKDLASATAQLKAARERALWIEECPEGRATHRRKQLPAVKRRWKKAVGDFKIKLETVTSKMGELQPTNEEATAVATALEKLARLFTPAAFDSTITAIASAAEDEAARGPREKALGTVRRYKKYILKDPRFKLLKANPFTQPFTGTHLLYNALLDVEKNLLISL